MISKELLSEVFSGGAINFSEIKNTKTGMIGYHYEQEVYIGDGDSKIEHGDGFVNIYELAHKCKEWALKHKYYITEWHDFIDVQHEDGISDFRSDLDLYPAYSPEWTFKACQYILDNKDKQC